MQRIERIIRIARCAEMVALSRADPIDPLNPKNPFSPSSEGPALKHQLLELILRFDSKMSAAMPFTSAHVSSLAARAAELEQLGEEKQDPDTLVRAARLYTLAVRIADDIDDREALPFMHSDLARVRDELRMLATRTVAESQNGNTDTGEHAADATGSMTRMFREVAVRIEQRLTARPSATNGAAQDSST